MTNSTGALHEGLHRESQDNRTDNLDKLNGLFSDVEAFYTHALQLKSRLEERDYVALLNTFISAGERKHREAVQAIHAILAVKPVAGDIVRTANDVERRVCAKVAHLYLLRKEITGKII